MDSELNDDDLKMLIEATECLEKKDSADEAIGMMMATMMAPSKDQLQAHLKEMQAKKDSKSKDREILKERLTLLRAKLIGLRQSLAASRI